MIREQTGVMCDRESSHKVDISEQWGTLRSSKLKLFSYSNTFLLIGASGLLVIFLRGHEGEEVERWEWVQEELRG